MSEQPWVVALAGNPNVGKSTVFNALTGLKQHTGNWPGKTVGCAEGVFQWNGRTVRLVDLPGTYSLRAHSEEEAVARDFLCRQRPDAVILVCDAGCLERNLNLALQVIGWTERAVVCVNLMDEAKKKGIEIDLAALQEKLGVPVVAAAARKGEGLQELMQAVSRVVEQPPCGCKVPYPRAVEEALDCLQPALEGKCGGIPARTVALRLLLGENVEQFPIQCIEIHRLVGELRRELVQDGYPVGRMRDCVAECTVRCAERIAKDCVRTEHGNYSERDRKWDRILTGRWTGLLLMVLMLLGIFWLTVFGANRPSEWLATGFEWLGGWLGMGLETIGAPEWLRGVLLEGVYAVVARVVAVMLPPMAIFFPLFTLLEDAGILPRVAFNLDRGFQKAKTCGKQALTMCMGLGCSAVGVTGCRIIDSPRERKIAMLTNSFVPCNGKYPAMIALISGYFAAGVGTFGAAGMLTGIILFGIGMTLLVSRILSGTLLKGTPSSFALELPPYRWPQVGRVLVRSVGNRVLFVLGRAAAVAAPAGMVLWVLANVAWNGENLLTVLARTIDPIGWWIGLDGAILLAFLLAFPANEIVLPICSMIYSEESTLSVLSNTEMKQLFDANGWNGLTALCVLFFFLLHWPCSTTCWTVRKESGSWKWTVAAVLIPTVCGVVVCFLIAGVARLFGLG